MNWQQKDRALHYPLVFTQLLSKINKNRKRLKAIKEF